MVVVRIFISVFVIYCALLMSVKDSIVVFEGFQAQPSFIAKEMTVVPYDYSANYQHFMFNPPENLILSPRDQRSVAYCENLNGLTLTDDCYLPYEMIGYILAKLSNSTIYTAGHQARDLLKYYLPYTTVIDVCSNYGFKYPLQLESVKCFKQHSARYCSLSKAFTLKARLHTLGVFQ